MIWIQYAIATAFAVIAIYLFWKGKIKEGLAAAVGFFAVAISFLKPKRDRKKTPFQELTAIENKVKKAKKEADEAVLKTIPENRTDVERWKRWEDL